MNKRTTQGKVAICSIFLTPERKFSCIFLNDAQLIQWGGGQLQ